MTVHIQIIAEIRGFRNQPALRRPVSTPNQLVPVRRVL